MLSFFPRDVLDEILNLIESASEGFPSYSYLYSEMNFNPKVGVERRERSSDHAINVTAVVQKF